MNDTFTHILWYCLSPEVQEALAAYQLRHFKTKVSIPPQYEVTQSLEELEREMKKKPDTSYEKVR